MAVESSFPDIHVTGPIHWFARTPSHLNYSTGSVAEKIWYLGTCETKPQLQVTEHKLDVFNDIGGRKAPFQQIKQGTTGVLGLAMNRFSHVAYSAIQVAGGFDLQTDSGNTAVGQGSENWLSRGALVFGRSSVELWARYSFYGTTNASTSLPIGRYFRCAVLDDHQLLKSGTEEKNLLLVFSAHSRWTGTGAPASGGLGFKCYSELVADFPSDFNTAATLVAAIQ